MTPDLGCDNCERCTWDPGGDCGKSDYPLCERCGHCRGRHVFDSLRGPWDAARCAACTPQKVTP